MVQKKGIIIVSIRISRGSINDTLEILFLK